jgi:hypothetical protein
VNASDRLRYLEPSPYAEDCGNLVGKDPRKIPRAIMADIGGPQTPTRAIRAKCLDCSGGSQSEVRKCVAVECPLWPFRMGGNVFHALAKERMDEVNQ